MSARAKFRIIFLVCSLTSSVASLVTYCAERDVRGDHFEDIKSDLFGDEQLIQRALAYTGEKAKHAFFAVAARGKRSHVEAFIERGDDVNMRDEEGRTPVMLAALYGNDTTLAHLVHGGADLTAKDSKGRSVLYYTMLFPDAFCPEIVDSQWYASWSRQVCFLPKHIDYSIYKENGFDCVRHSFSNSVKFVHECLVEQGMCDEAACNLYDLVRRVEHYLDCRRRCTSVEGEASDEEERSIKALSLEDTIPESLIQTFKFLDTLWKQGNIRSESERSRQIFFDCACTAYIPLIRLFLDNGFDVNMRDPEGNTLLTYAALTGQAKFISYLISRGADRRAANAFGETPYYYAKCLRRVLGAYEEAIKQRNDRLLFSEDLVSMMHGDYEAVRVFVIAIGERNRQIGTDKNREELELCCQLLSNELASSSAASGCAE